MFGLIRIPSYDSIPSLDATEESYTNNPKKKQKKDGDGKNSILHTISDDININKISYHANEIIDLIFYDSHDIITIIEKTKNSMDSTKQREDKLFMKSYNPTYTHQIFENETIFMERMENISIYIHSMTLEHRVVLPRYITSSESNELLTLLDNALPNDRVILSSSSSLSSIDIVHKIQELDETIKYQPIPGRVIHSFQRNETELYEVRLAQYKNMESTSTTSDRNYTYSLLKKCEKIAMWFIETADSIDFTDDRWEILFLVKVNSSFSAKHEEEILMGYFTLFNFRNPFMGCKLRICQALIFPPFQSNGFGMELMKATYQIASCREEVVEVTVEDPAPGCMILRDHMDIQHFLSHIKDLSIILNLPLHNLYDQSQTSHSMESIKSIYDRIDQILSSSDIIESMAKKLKIVTGMVKFVLRAWQYYLLHSTLIVTDSNQTQTTIDDSTNEDLNRMFRLSVKRSLLQENSGLKGLLKSEMQSELEELFTVEEKRYQRVQKYFLSFVI